MDADAAYRALLVRDARLDGKLFVGVTSTGVYCRPICRVRTPRRENCRFFDTPAQAEAAEFRPCLKCRPEIAPGAGLPWSVMDASRTLARQAAQWLDAHAFDDADGASLADLAARLGVSDRHLRRIFAAEHGVTALQYVQTRRLLLAKQLLTDTALPVTQVAHASGFRSVRRFNAAFADSYRLSPTGLRRAGATRGAPPAATLAYREPLARDALLAFLAQRAIPGVESVTGEHIRRSVRADAFGAHPAGWIEVGFVPEAAQVRVDASPSLAPALGPLLGAVRRWLDLDADAPGIASALAGLPHSEGLRLPGGIDAFELAVRAVLGQQVTVAAARTLARRVVDRFGTAIATPWNDEVARCFPAPAALAACDIAAIAELGIIRSRAGAIIALASAWAELLPQLQPGAPAQPLVERLTAIPGVGAWTAHYIAMRALGWSDAFPPGDVAVLNALKLPRGAGAEREAQARAQAWRPWRAYAVLALWKRLEKTT